jgi:hypothetical protein
MNAQRSNAPGGELSRHIPYHSHMRHLLLALLVTLLPLRGWIGDAMATQMAAGQIQHSQSQQHGQHHGAPQTVADHQDETLAAAHFDHEEAAQALPAAEPDCAGHGMGADAPAADGHCDSCAACQACNTVALSLTGPDLSPAFKSLSLPFPAADHFASADSALRQKPPIS